MRLIVTCLLLLAAHFSLTAFVPAAAGQAWALWPFAADSRPILSVVGGLPQQGGSVLTPLLAGVAGLGFLAAALGLFSRAVPAEWWNALVIIAAAASILLYLLYGGRFSIMPIVVDLLLLWGVVGLAWSVPSLRGIA